MVDVDNRSNIRKPYCNCTIFFIILKNVVYIFSCSVLSYDTERYLYVVICVLIFKEVKRGRVSELRPTAYSCAANKVQRNNIGRSSFNKVVTFYKQNENEKNNMSCYIICFTLRCIQIIYCSQNYNSVSYTEMHNQGGSQAGLFLMYLSEVF